MMPTPSGLQGRPSGGAGVAIDHRETGYAAYGDLGFKPVVETAGTATPGVPSVSVNSTPPST